MKTKNIITKTQIPAADFAANPYLGCIHGCIYCYAEFMKRFRNIEGEWGKNVVCKEFDGVNTKSLTNKTIILSSVTDPYQPIERKMRLTRKILTNFIGKPISVEILTKSKFVLDDIDLFKKLNSIRIGLSLNCADDKIREKIEPRASSVSDRLETLKLLRKEKFNLYAFISPLFPFISDYENVIEKIAPYTDEIGFENLNLRGAFRKRVYDFYAEFYPQYADALKSIYSDKGYFRIYWDNVKAKIIKACKERKIKYKIFFYHDEIMAQKRTRG